MCCVCQLVIHWLTIYIVFPKLRLLTAKCITTINACCDICYFELVISCFVQHYAYLYALFSPITPQKYNILANYAMQPKIKHFMPQKKAPAINADALMLCYRFVTLSLRSLEVIYGADAVYHFGSGGDGAKYLIGRLVCHWALVKCVGTNRS